MYGADVTQRERQTERQTDRQTDRQTERERERERDRQTDTQTSSSMINDNQQYECNIINAYTLLNSIADNQCPAVVKQGEAQCAH